MPTALRLLIKLGPLWRPLRPDLYEACPRNLIISLTNVQTYIATIFQMTEDL